MSNATRSSAAAATPPSYRGVRKRSEGKWVTETVDPLTKTRYWLGSYDTAQMAALAYDSAVSYFHGSNARLNFLRFRSTLPRPATSNKQDVTDAARDASKLDVSKTHIQLSPGQIEAIRDSRFDWYETWTEEFDNNSLEDN